MQDEILDFLRKNADMEFTCSAIANGIGENRQAVGQALLRLLRWGDVERIPIKYQGDPRWERMRWKYKPTS